MRATTTFVMLGARDSKGRIVKNESYTLVDFYDKTICKGKVLYREKWWHKLIPQSYSSFLIRETRKVVLWNIMDCIEHDNFGRKKVRK